MGSSRIIETQATVLYLPFEALLCVSDAIHQHHDKKLQQVRVIYLKSVIIVCEINKFIFCTLPSYIQEQLIPLISDETTQSPAFHTIFNKLEGEEDLTRYRLESIWKNSFPAIMPIAVILNEGNPSFEWATDTQGKCLLQESKAKRKYRLTSFDQSTLFQQKGCFSISSSIH
jgi:hypothetical protein